MIYDPMKEINKNKYLNDVFLKTRYSLLQNNEENEKKGIEIGSHWKKFIKYPFLDNDIIESQLRKENLKEINDNYDKIINRVKESKIREYLNEIDNTKEFNNEITKIKNKNNTPDFIRESLKVPLFYHNLPKERKLFFKKINHFKIEKDEKKKIKPFSFSLRKSFQKLKKTNYEPKYDFYSNKRGKCIFPDINNINEKNEEESINFFNDNYEKKNLNTLKKNLVFKNISSKNRERKVIKLNYLINESKTTDYNNNTKNLSSKNFIFENYKKNKLNLKIGNNENLNRMSSDNYNNENETTYDKSLKIKFNKTFETESNNSMIKKLKQKLGNKIKNIKV